MKPPNRSQWDAGRFIETITYFDVIPFLGCLIRLFTGSNNHNNHNNHKNMDVILVANATSEVGQKIVSLLLNNNYQVIALVPESAIARQILGEKVELKETVNPTLMAEVSAIIYCNDSQGLNLTNLVEIAKKSLKSGEKLLFDFQNPTLDLKEIWGAVDDVVMGGVSQSSIRLVQNRAIFSGIVSTDNNGGFASVRTRNLTPPWDLSDYEGIELRLQGDGKRYKFIIRCEGRWDGVGYCYSFDTIYNYWLTIRIPFSDLIPVFRAKTVPEAGAFDASLVYSMQLMLSKFEYDGGLNPSFSAGVFGLEIESIKAYGRKETLPELILVNSRWEEDIVKESGLKYTIIQDEQANIEAIANLSVKALKEG